MPDPSPTLRLKGRGGQNGFTLVELMVVLAIIGISATAVVLMLPGVDGAAQQDAERFASRLVAARDHAVFSGRQTSALIDARGYRFEENVRGEWAVIRSAPLGARVWDTQVSMSADAPLPLRIRFDSVGMADGADIQLISGEKMVTIKVLPSGEAQLQTGLQ